MSGDRSGGGASLGARLAEAWLAEFVDDAARHDGVGSLNFVGRAWLHRRWQYWLGRLAATTFFLVLTFLVLTGPAWGMVAWLSPLSWPDALVLVPWLAWCLLVCVVALRNLRLHGFVVGGREGRAPYPAGVMLGLVLGALVGLPGLVLAGVLATLRRDFPGEPQARLVHEAWRAGRLRRRR